MINIINNNAITLLYIIIYIHNIYIKRDIVMAFKVNTTY